MTWSEQVRQTLCGARINAELSRLELATAIEISERSVRRIENGKHEAKPRIVDKWLVACKLGATIDLHLLE